MALKITSVKCPECGAVLQIEEGRKQIFCSYCGANVIMTNENEYVYRYVDEAEVKHAETEHIIQMKKLELLEKKRQAMEEAKKRKIKLTKVLGIIAAICIGMGCLGIFSGLTMPGIICFIVIIYIWKKDDEDITEQENKIKVPSAISGFENKNYVAVEAIFCGAGLKNVKSVPLNDLTVGFMKKPGMVESITINGHEVSTGGKKYSKEAAVVISYHSYR